MKKISKNNQAFLEKLMADYNDYSEIVALNYENGVEEGTLQWNRGSLNKAKEHLEEFAELMKVKLVFTFGTHPFLDRELSYTTVTMEGQNPNYHLTSCGLQR